MLLWNLFQQGGFVMWPLLLCSVVALAIVLERAWYYWISTRTSSASEEVTTEAVTALAGGRRLEAMQLVRKERGVASNLISAALAQSGQPQAVIEQALSRAGQAEVLKLQRGLGTLEAIVTVAPLLGLLGTVTGIIRTFNVVGAMKGLSTPAQMAPGIAEALFTTAFGLMIASPAVIIHAIFIHEVDRRVVKMNDLAGRILQALAQGGDRA